MTCNPFTDRQTHTHTQSDYLGHPFRVSGFFPSNYLQGSAQLQRSHVADISTFYEDCDWGKDCPWFGDKQNKHTADPGTKVFGDHQNICNQNIAQTKTHYM